MEITSEQRYAHNKMMFEFWGLPYPKKPDPTVHVWTDPNVLKYGSLVKSRFSESLEDDLTAKPTTKLSRMGAVKSQERQKRMMELINLIDNDGVKTIQEALSKIETIKTEKTIKDYLKIIGRKLVDETTGKVFGSDETRWDLLDKSKNEQSQTKKLGTQYKYYTKDPNKGGLSLTKDDYIAYRENLRSKIEKVGN